jgi:putative hydrolase of the HAD superfamily
VWRVLHPLVVFDAGFTLIRPRQTLAEAMHQALADHGHSATIEEIRLAWEAADAWFWENYHQPGNQTWTSDASIEETWRSYHRLMLDRLGVTDAGHDMMEAILAGQFSHESWETYPETVEALERARDAGSKVAIASDWGSTLPDVIRGVGLADYIDVWVVSAIDGVAKPAPEFFRLTLERAGVDASQAVMIGDSYRADVLGARLVGMDAVLLDREGTADEVEGPVAASLTEALDLAGELAAARGADAPVP